VYVITVSGPLNSTNLLVYYIYETMRLLNDFLAMRRRCNSSVGATLVLLFIFAAAHMECTRLLDTWPLHGYAYNRPSLQDANHS
jgi:ABC-type sugar transport system permease subunit